MINGYANRENQQWQSCGKSNRPKGKPHLDKYFVYDYDDWKTQQTIENIAIEKYNGE